VLNRAEEQYQNELPRVNEFFKKHPDMSFNEIDLKNTIVVSSEESRPLL
jgi:hypothetical protein